MSAGAGDEKTAVDAYLDACAARAERPLDILAMALRDPHSIKLTGLNLSESAVECLVEGLRMLKNLNAVHLTNLHLSPTSFKDLVQVLTIGSLSRLSISGISMGSDSLNCLMPMLRSLALFELQAADIGNAGAAALAEYLAPAIALQQLSLYANRIKCQGVIALAAAFQINSSLQIIDLRTNEIGDSGAAALAKALQQNGSIRQLLLSENRIGAEGAAQIAGSQARNGKLQVLDLAANQIGDAGAAALAQMCKGSNSMVELHLGANGLGDEGFTALGDALKVNERLQKVFLDGAPMGPWGVGAIAAALKANRSLRELAIEIDPSNPHAGSAIANALRSNTSITELHLGNAPIDEAVLAAINGTLRVNKFITTIGNAGSTQTPSSPSVLAEACSSIALTTPAHSRALTTTIASPLVAATQPPLLPPPPPRSPPSKPRSPQFAPPPSSGHTLGTSMTAARMMHAPSPPQPASSMGSGGRRAAAIAARMSNGGARVPEVHNDAPAMAGWNKRLEQLAAAMEVRLQAQEAQVIRLANELHTERLHSAELAAKVDKMGLQLSAAEAERANLREALTAEQARREKLAEELRWVDEAGVQARAQEELQRRKADEAMSEQLRSHQADVAKLHSSIEAFEQSSRNAVTEMQQFVSTAVEDLTRRVAVEEANLRTECEQLRAQLKEMLEAAEVASEVSETVRSLEAGQQKLQEEVRWIDEEHMRCRAEDENSVRALVQDVRESLSAQLEHLRSKEGEQLEALKKQLNSRAETLHTQLGQRVEVLQVQVGQRVEALRAQMSEKMVALGDPNAIEHFKHTSAQVDTLSQAVDNLCAYMESLRFKDIITVADSRTKEVEERLAQQTGAVLAHVRKAHDALVQRVDELENALHKEQESSLKALQAILSSQTQAH